MAASLIGLCAILTFVPFRFVHPLRVKRLRNFTVMVMLAWAGAAISAIGHGFPGTDFERVIFVAAAVYIVALGLSTGTGRHRPESNIDGQA